MEIIKIIIYFTLGICVGRFMYNYLNGTLWFQKKKVEKVDIPPSEHLSSSKHLPPGYTIDFNTVTKRYRPCDEKGISSAFTDKTIEETTKHAWDLYHTKLDNDKNNWIKLK